MEKFQTHACDLLPQDVGIAYTNTDFGRFKWSMSICRTATEEDLESNHILEEEGQLIWQTSIEIICCPYCGVALAESRAYEQEDFGSRKCFSFASWASVEL